MAEFAAEHLRQRAAARRQAQGRKGLRRRPPAWLHPSPAERTYRAALLVLVERARDAVMAILPQLRTILPEKTRADDGLTVETIGDRIRAVFGEAEARAIAARMAQGVQTFNRQQFRRVLSSVVGVDVFAIEPRRVAALLSAAEAENVQLVVGQLAETLATQAQGVFTQALRGGLRAEELAASLEERFDVGRSRAKTIARDQVSKLNGALTKERQESIGVTQYVWRTVGDERVRESHQAHDGKVFDWEDPPADTGHPGEDINCRCSAEMVVPEDLLE